jgi:guanylate kinase
MGSLTTDPCVRTTAPLVVVSGPSGSGKTTLVRELVNNPPWPLRLSLSVTTRKPREREVDGVHYRFWTRDRFDAGVKAGEFLEWADNFGNCYGTLRSEVEPYRTQGTGVLLEIDVKGWAQVRQKCSDATSIFIRTSSLEVLERRLRERHTESEEAIQRRLAGARVELAEAHHYRHQVVNDDLAEAEAELKRIIASLFART